MSELRTNRIVPRDGLPSGSSGGVIQVKSATKTDWRASSDLTLSDAWKTYRQALRDLPASASPKLDSNYELDLTSVTWPTEPS